MRKVLLGTLGLLLAAGVFAQNAKRPLVNPNLPFFHTTWEQKYANYKTGNEIDFNKPSQPIQQPQNVNRGVGEAHVGVTTYDLQTNNTLCRRTVNLGGGQVIVGWTRSTSGDLNATDRGTGYNYNDGTGWGPAPTARIENQRTGWATLGVTASGREFAISHTVSSGLNMSHRNVVGTGTWSHNVFSTETNDIWPRAAVTGDSIYVITSRQTPDLFNGLDGGLALYRSWDQGDTWLGADSVPGVNTTNFARMGGDTYQIDARGDVVAFVCGNFQPTLFKSFDAGATWNMTVIVPASDPLYTGQVGESLDTMVTSDEAYEIYIDDNNLVHVWFGQNVVWDDDPTTAGWTYQPYNNGMLYWRENLAEPVLIHNTRIANDQDPGDCTFTIPVNDDATQAYFGNIVTGPSVGVDANGGMYLAYAALRDGDLDNNGAGLRNTYLVKSLDGGNTWHGPYNVNDTLGYETMYASVARFVDDSVHLVVQQDNVPGTAVQDASGPAHPYVTNDIIYHAVGVSEIVNGVDIDCPTISVPDDTVIAFQGCPFDPGFYDATTFTDDIPQGPINQNIQSSGTIDVNVAGIYTLNYWVVDDAGNSSDTVQRVVEVVADTDPPVITLNGPSHIDILVNTPYTELGATVSDNASCDLNATLMMSGMVDTMVIDTYYIDFDVMDNSGNNAVTVTRSVGVIAADVTGPVITPIGDDPFISEVFTPYMDSSATAWDNVDFDVSNTVMTVSNNVDINVVGSYTVDYTAQDLSGNVGTGSRTVEVVDLTAPNLVLDGDTTCYNDTVGTAFDEPGFTSIDNYDGDITATVDVDMSGVDMNAAGMYTITYTSTDASMNMSQKTRGVCIEAQVASAFTFTENGGMLTLTDASTNNPTSWDWDLGDGNVKCCTNANPTHQYQQVGTYTVCLDATNSAGGIPSCQDVTVDEIAIGINSNFDNPNHNILVSPNPNNGAFTLQINTVGSHDYEVSVFNLLGEMVSESMNVNVHTQRNMDLDLTDLAQGVYLVKVKNEFSIMTQKVTITGK